jgi:hypothetical protein
MRFLKLKLLYVCAVILLIFTSMAGSNGENRSEPAVSEKVVFSEVLYDSEVSYEKYGEWIELYNPQSTAVDISGWKLQDNAGTFTIPSGNVINAHSYFIITDDASYFQGRYGCVPNISQDTVKLANTGDFLILKNKSGTTIDQVAWEKGGSSIAGWGSSSLPKADEDKTIQRKNPNTDSDTYADWRSNCTPDPVCGGGGTPQPIIVLSKSTLEFNVTSSGTVDAQTFTITNGGSGTLSCSISSNKTWLKYSPGSGTDGTVISVSVDTTGLSNGTYTGKITVTDTNASNSPQTINVTLIVDIGGGTPQPEIVLSKSYLYFTVFSGGTVGAQEVTISNGGSGTLNWSIATSATWLTCSPTFGTGGAVISVSVNTTGLSNGTHLGTLTVTDPNASNSPQIISVTLNLLLTDSQPFGEFATPLEGSYVSGSIPVTGWALDDVGIESLKIYRNEGQDSFYIGDAIFVEGARPDIQNAYPGYPDNHKAGWGYMLLTYFLPDNGNGTFVLEARVKDTSGKEVSLGTKTIICDNANAVKPFGAIDTPIPGGTVSGPDYKNVGWVLTPMPNMIPTDGSTIYVYVDAVKRGNVNYNIYREDIAGYFPGYANSNGAAGYFDLDTTAYADGVHTISWAAVDNAGNADGIGSRYFSIQNSSSHSNARRGNPSWLPDSNRTPIPGGILDIADIPVDYSSPVSIKKDYNQNVEPQHICPTDNGIITLGIKELERIEIKLFPEGTAELATLYAGYQIVDGEISPLPIGSTFDKENGIFYWQPGPGFVGCYKLVFIENHPHGPMKKTIEITILPR